jgi:hypothetical protein
MKRLFCLLFILVLIAPFSNAANKQEDPKPLPAPDFGKLKTLVGKWECTSSCNHEGMPKKMVVTYRLTSGGSALIETIFPGTSHEMVSVYHGDGDELVMTHYCMLGNQPQMRCDDPKATPMVFAFDGGTGVSSKGPYMRSLKVTFIDKDHFNQEWEFYDGGKLKSVEKTTYTRVK